MIKEERNILIVEDEKPDLEIIKRFLKKAYKNILIYESSSLNKSLEMISTIHFDIILLDLGLEDSIGYETFESIKNSQNKYAPVIVITSDINPTFAS